MQQTKRTETTEPYLSWCLIARNCEDTIEETLKSLRERTPQAEIVVVDTCSSDRTPEIAKKYADVWVEYKGPRGDWDKEMPAFDDASAARQYSFELASGYWRGWVDADDVLPGPDEVARLLKLNGRWKPQEGQHTTIDTVGEPMSLEDMLRRVDDEFSDTVNCIYAPYLYQRDEHDRCITWQERERIVKWSDNWQWMESSHEVLCPKDGVFGNRVTFSTLLFVHEKKFTDENLGYAVDRHYRVILDQYEKGDITSRRAMYLITYSKKHCPERQGEFVDAMYRYAASKEDRYRARLAEAEYYLERGMYQNAVEAIGSATSLIPDLPDAWVILGGAAIEARDWVRAQSALETAMKYPATMNSLMNPRAMAIDLPVQLAMVLEKIAGLRLNEQGDTEGAAENYRVASELLSRVVQDPAVGVDRERVAGLSRKVSNLRGANHIAQQVAFFADYLVNNDEPAKVLDLIAALPHTLEDHPITVKLEKWSKRIQKHITDPVAYEEFYQSVMDYGMVKSPAYLLDQHSQLSREWVARAFWAADIINKECPNGTIVDVGCFDGTSAIPLLQRCPGIKYIGYDLCEKAVVEFRDRIEKLGMSDRAEVRLTTSAEPHYLLDEDLAADATIWFEVIEHVPDPRIYLDIFAQTTKEGAPILISTPWGSFDDGLPNNIEDRDERGHVRAMTARSFSDEMDRADLDIVQLYNHAIDSGCDSLHADVRCIPRRGVQAPVSFAVCGALWDWNSTTVHKGGFGASEETICYLAEALAGERKVDVFGPVPSEEVQAGVGYWPHVQLRNIRPDSKVVVSRAPHWGASVIDEIIGFETEKILWLQDAVYPDLNKDVAAYYEKIVCVSEWHKQTMHEQHQVPLDKIVVAYNFLLPEHFEIEDRPEREPHHFIYASSPDRGLINLLQLWPRVLEMYPDATLDIFYGWRGMNRLGSGVLGQGNGWTNRFESVRKQYETLRYQKGVTEKGMVSHTQIAREFMRAAAWAYPTDFLETGCANAVKARAAGCVPVTSGLAALNETAACAQSILVPHRDVIMLNEAYQEQWLEGIRRAVETSESDRELMATESIDTYKLSSMVPIWKGILG